MRRLTPLPFALALGLLLTAATRQRIQPTPLTAATPNAYVSPAVCAQCHADVARTYAQTGMGRSFRPVTAAALGVPLPAQPYFHAPSQTFYTVVQHGSRFFERQWQTGYDGKETNVSETSIDDVLGSGHHAMAFLHLTRRHTLEELPFGWYSENGGTWAMQPGYDRPDHDGTSRQIGYECMFCHNAYPANAATARLGAEPVYPLPLPHGIDCQRCHGPGLRHVETVEHGGTIQQIRASIVNPATLGPTREMEVCMQCHLETTSLKLPHALLRVGRLPFSYIPGQPLGNYELAFDRAPGQNTRFEIDSAAYRLRQSQCFIQTQSWARSRRLQCTTCHDPHNIPRGAAAERHYNAACQTCHSPAAVLAQSPRHPAAGDCIRCHMPRRRTADGIHIVMTDHLIQLRPPPHPLAPRKEFVETSANAYRGPVELYYPPTLPPTPQNQLDLAVAQVKDDSNLTAGIRRLTALIQKFKPPQADYDLDLAAALRDAGHPRRSRARFEQALRLSPRSAPTLLQFAQAQLGWRQWMQAAATLRRAARITPSDPDLWQLLGEAEYEQGQSAAARRSLHRALSLNPDAAGAYNYLGLMNARAGHSAAAEADFRHSLAIAPNVAPSQANLAALLAAENRLPEAGFLFQHALHLNPALVSAHINYGRLLAGEGHPAQAELQARAAVQADGRSPAAHEFLGYLLELQGHATAAVAELTTAVRLQPDFWRAHLELGVALDLTGDTAGWRRQLTLAAHGADPAVRATAAQMLQSGPY